MKTATVLVRVLFLSALACAALLLASGVSPASPRIDITIPVNPYPVPPPVVVAPPPPPVALYYPAPVYGYYAPPPPPCYLQPVYVPGVGFQYHYHYGRGRR